MAIVRTSIDRLAILFVQDANGNLIEQPNPIVTTLGTGSRAFDVDGDGDLDVGTD